MHQQNSNCFKQIVLFQNIQLKKEQFAIRPFNKKRPFSFPNGLFYNTSVIYCFAASSISFEIASYLASYSGSFFKR